MPIRIQRVRASASSPELSDRRGSRRATITTTRLTIAAVALCAAACQLPVPGTAPSNEPVLEIRGTTFMMVGGRGKLTAWLLDEGEAREVSARWTTDSDVVSITGAGMVTARRLGGAAVRAHYDDHSGTGIVHVVSTVAGTWRGSVTVLDCGQVVVSSPDPCASRRGLTAPLVLSVSQSAAAELGNLTGTIALFNPAATGAFAGLLDSGGVFFVQGHVERPGDGLQGGVTFRWILEGERLVPMEIDETVDVSLASRQGAGWVTFAERWQISPLTR
jgi:hypothetical protein